MLHHFLHLEAQAPNLLVTGPQFNDKGRRNRRHIFDKLKPYAHIYQYTIPNSRKMLITPQNKGYL